MLSIVFSYNTPIIVKYLHLILTQFTYYGNLIYRGETDMGTNMRKSIVGYVESLDNFKVIVLYRQASLIFTSLFYIAMDIGSLKTRCLVILSVLISSEILLYLYKKSIDESKVLKVLLIIECVGITLILIPSGGLKSPYIWYAFNTILIAIFYLPSYFKWLNVMIYLGLTLHLSRVIYGNHYTPWQTVLHHDNIFLIFILSTLALALISRMNTELKKKSKELSIKNEELSAIYKQSHNSMCYMTELYHAIEMLSNQSTKKEIIYILLSYINKMVRAEEIIFYYKEEKFKSIHGMAEVDIETVLCDISSQNEPTKYFINNRKYIFMMIPTTNGATGLVGMSNDLGELSLFYEQSLAQLKFTAELSAVFLEKAYYEEINANLIISEEQERIANEIHDSVCQRLFAISCATHALNVNHDRMTSDEFKNVMADVRSSADLAMKELRSVIYGLSYKNEAKESFETQIGNYLRDLSNLHHIDIDFRMDGQRELLNYNHQKAFYRIICEATGNAIRHGKARHISVSLNIGAYEIFLNITDDGIGYEQTKAKSNKGLGIKNIYSLSRALHGSLFIDSKKGKGTTLRIQCSHHRKLSVV